MTSGQPDASVVVPNLDGGARVIDAFRSALDQDGVRIEAILVDNGSSDGSPDEAARLDSRVRVLRNQRNTGFGAACNRGASVASGRYLLFLNNDATLPDGALARLVAEADDDPTAAVWQPLVVSESGALESAGTRMTRAGFLWPLPAESGTGRTTVFAATAACMLVRRDVFAALAGFSEAYFAYFEDADLCWRARMAGWEVRVINGIRVPHARGTTSARVLTPAQIYHLGYRNRLRAILSNAGPATMATAVPLQILSCLLIAAGFLVAGRLREGWAILRAVAWPLGNSPTLRMERRRAQAARTIGDHLVLRGELRTPLTPRRALTLFTGSLGRWGREASN